MSKKRNSIEHLQEINFNEYYIQNTLNQLYSIKTSIEGIFSQFIIFKENFIKNLDKYYTNLSKEIESYIFWLEITKNFNEKKEENIKIQDDFEENINKYFNECINIIKKMNKSENLLNINEYNNNIRNIIDDFYQIKFNPPKFGEIDSSIIKINLNVAKNDTSTTDSNISSEDPFFSYDQKIERNSGFFDKKDIYLKKKNNSNNNMSKIKDLDFKEYQEDNKNSNNKYLICSECKSNEVINICSHCNKYYCKDCTDFIFDYNGYSNHKLEKIDDKLLNREKEKDLFLQNFIGFIKYYLLKCNDILEIKSTNFDFPSIENIEELESQKKYLEKINEICLKYGNEFNESKDDIKDGRIINYLENLFGNKKIHVSKNIQDIDDENLFEDNHAIEEEKEEETELNKNKNNLLFFITVIAKNGIVLNTDISNIIIQKISDILKINNNNIFILLNDYANNFVKSKNFSELSYNEMEFGNPIFNQMKEIKILTDFLCNECCIPKYFFDCKGNCVNPNKSLNLIRGTEIYDPPYGWLGIGLNVEGKYDNGDDDWLNNKTKSCKWAIAYHGISSKFSSEIIKKILIDIITNNGITKGISKIKSNSNDIRHSKKVGEGIYLSPKVKNAEKFTGIISYNNKSYKVLLMAKVYIDEIREPENSNFWVLNEKNIRIYRVLFKEIS